MSGVRNIHNGPDLHRLSIALFFGGNSEQITVTFMVGQPNFKMHEIMKVESAQREDGSGQKWNLVCFNVGDGKRYKIFYDTSRRSGVIEQI